MSIILFMILWPEKIAILLLKSSLISAFIGEACEKWIISCHINKQGCHSHQPFLLLFSHSVVSNSLWLHGLQNTRLPCPSQDPGACSNSCPLSQWCHPTISSSVVPFSSCPQSFPASGSFLMSQLFASGSQSIGALASGSVLLMNIQGWFSLG